jgi:hypothetical protein
MLNDTLENQIILNTRYVSYVKSLYKHTDTIETKINIIDYLIKFQTLNVTTKLSDEFSEQELNKISQNINFKLEKRYKENSVLHVLSEAYSTGGHTKLLELFISNTSKYFTEQSTVVLNQKVPFPKSLEKITIDNGELYIFQKDSIIKKAKKLANLASQYHYVVLHIHPKRL